MSVVCCSHTPPLPPVKPVPNICDRAKINPDGAHLDVPIIIQGNRRWCWVAAPVMIGIYYSKQTFRLCEIVTETKKPTLTLTSTSSQITVQLDCCAPYTEDINCDRGGDDDEIRQVFKLVGYEHRTTGGVLSERELQIELSSNRPVMLTIRAVRDVEEYDPVTKKKKKIRPAHVRVISGFTPAKPPDTPAQYRVLDSNFKAPLKRTYAELILEPEHLADKPYLWEDSWVLTATAAPECKKELGE